MKELNELNDRIDGMDELVDSIIKKLDAIEKMDLKPADYTAHFEALKQIFEVFLLRYNKESNGLMEAVSKLNIEYPAEQIQNNLAELKTILEAIKKELPIKVRHQLDTKTQGWVILLFVIVISLILNGYLWTENTRLQAVDIKYRLLNQLVPTDTQIADSVYTADPDKTEKMVSELANRKINPTKPGKIKKAVTAKRYTKGR
ncbi:MAG: hypothetical protein M3O71_23125 [Bacteroidota bacterium]|nr:hypothetical protein [Bacteroidota bacterium]